ncbi:MAG TPA: RNA 3'-terminal phosphate cyclase [Abditibacteriaceae bacterium]|nr:RNA 3'-terminal phosphate cyclase [Abditibacteriaceae bacterium]
MSNMVEIDGSFGEGGGQIIRTALSLAIMTGHAVGITNVRARRTKPGLQPQHLAAVRAAAAVCDARLAGDSVGSRALTFEPQTTAKAGNYRFDIGTAGAAPLVVQTVLLPLTQAAGASTVTVTGGTHVPHSPTVEYLEAVYVPLLRRAGLDVTLSYTNAGFYPRGGGQMDLVIQASTGPKPLVMNERGRLEELRAFIITSNLPEHVAERGAVTVERSMKAVGRKIIIERRERPSPGTGAAAVIVARCQQGMAAFSAIGELRKPMEKVAEAPCREFMQWWKSTAACDKHLADQLVLPLSFATGLSHWTTPVVTEHLRTVLWVVRQFLSIDVELEEHEDGSGAVSLSPA